MTNKYAVACLNSECARVKRHTKDCVAYGKKYPTNKHPELNKEEEKWVDIIREWNKDDPYPPIRPLAKKITKALDAKDERFRNIVKGQMYDKKETKLAKELKIEINDVLQAILNILDNDK